MSGTVNVVDKIPEKLLGVLEALGILRVDVQDEADKIAAANPGIGLDKLAFILGDVLKAKVEPFLGLNAAVALMTKIKDEILSGHPGYDPQHGGVA